MAKRLFAVCVLLVWAIEGASFVANTIIWAVLIDYTVWILMCFVFWIQDNPVIDDGCVDDSSDSSDSEPIHF